MAQAMLRRSENIAGEFFVDTTCIDCDLCRQIAPSVFTSAGDMSAVYHQPENGTENFDALKALVTCPTASIGTVHHQSAKQASQAYPERIQENVYFCGYASENSYGASNYLIVRPEGNVLIDSPRYSGPLVKRIEELGGIRWIFLTHRDDVADQDQWASHFHADRIMHTYDSGRVKVERAVEGTEPLWIDNDLCVIPTPGHTKGHCVLLYNNRFLFSGDHVWWSEHYNSLHASRSVCWYSWSEQTRSMERLTNFQFEWVLPGHGRRHHASADEMQRLLRDCIKRMTR